MSSRAAAGRDANASASEFRRSHRLTARRQFLAVHEKGRRAGSRWFTLYGLPNDLGHPRLGITASRKTGGAVVRNRIKRVLREIFRYNRANLTPSLDLVVVARSGIEGCSVAELEKEFLRRFAELARRFET